MIKNIALLLIIFSSTSNFSIAQTSGLATSTASSSTSTTTSPRNNSTYQNSSKTEICKFANSLTPYSKENILILQKYLQSSFFPKIKVSGLYDAQTRYYIGKYQYAFGLLPTGILGEQTLKLLRKQNNCFDLEEKVLFLEKATVTKKRNQTDIIFDLVTQFIYPVGTTTNTNPIYNTEVKVTVSN